jgi:hypothetical protein
VGDDRIEVGFGVELGFGRADEAFKAAEAVEFVLVADLCGVERRIEWASILACASSAISDGDCWLIYPVRQSKMRPEGEDYDTYANNRISG